MNAEDLEPRVGVFVCECGGNISDVIDVKAVCDTARKWKDVAVVNYDRYLCSMPAQKMIIDAIREQRLNRVITASCTPRMHFVTFQSVLQRAGLNPYLLEHVNIREHCSWVHGSKKQKAMEKAISLIRGGYERSVKLEALEPTSQKCSRDVLVIGGGIAGITASLELGDTGYTVYLIDRYPSIGGNMAKLTKVFPTIDCAQCILTPKLAEVARHPKIKLLTYSEVKEVSGSPGNFVVKIVKKPKFVDEDKCTGCNKCAEVCPVTLSDEFNMGLGRRTAIYRPFPQAIPNVFTIDKRGIPPCRAACPAGVNVEGYVALIKQGKFKEAVELIRKEIPFPAVCGRVCFHPCEIECERGKVDEPLAINALKRFVADYELKGEKIAPIPKTREEKIAIIGSGPAGLSAAYDLVKRGYPVTVFESLPEPGGMLRVGIPQYRLPKEVLDAEIEYIKKLGVEIRTNIAVGKDLTIDDLLQDGYKAIFIAIGAQKNLKLGIEGEELKGVIHALDLLREVNLGRKVKLGNRVAVIGGGNVAVDAARTALRLGSKDVYILYRRSREEMPAYAPEVEEAEREGVKVQFLVAPIKILGEDGRVVAVECIRMMLGKPDESGRRRSVPIEGSEHVMELDTVIVAIGQLSDLSFLPKGVEVTRSTIVADPITLETSMPGVFAGGDVVSEPATVIDAIASGKRAAVSIDRYLRSEDLKVGRDEEARKVKEVPKEGVDKKPRQAVPLIPLSQRVGNFSEVVLGFTEDMAMKEAERCLFCGGCSECLECEKVCDPKAIIHQQEEECLEVKVGSIIVATGYELFDARKLEEYGYGVYPDVITMMDLERMTSLFGPTGGRVKRLSDGGEVTRVAIVLCAGSRDTNRAIPYCSRICCMYSLKQAYLLKEDFGLDVWVYYVDIRATGRGYEELYQRTQNAHVMFVRGKVAEIQKNNANGRLMVRAEDTALGRMTEQEFDLVALAVPMIPSTGLGELANKILVPIGEDGFIQEKHPKLDPVNSLMTGIFACGCALGPKDIRDTVSDALGAAAKASSFLSTGYVTASPEKPVVESALCDRCGFCVKVCPYNAVTWTDKRVEINPYICMGCGACVPECPRDAIDFKNSTEEQLFAQMRGVLADKGPEEYRILAFVDQTIAYAGADFLGLYRTEYPTETRIIKVPSTAILSLKHLLYAFAAGADGIAIIEGQHDIDERFMKQRIQKFMPSLEDHGIESVRIWYSLVMLPAYKKMAGIFSELAFMIQDLGPVSEETRSAIKQKLNLSPAET